MMESGGATGGDPVTFWRVSGGTIARAFSGSGFTGAAWNHGCVVGVSATSAISYCNGGTPGTDTTSCTPSGFDNTTIAVSHRDTHTKYFSGDIAEVAIWNAALDANEVTSLARGYSPLLVRPSALVAYWPLIGRFDPEIDVRAGQNFTLTNTPIYADHPKIIYPSKTRSMKGYTSVVAGGRIWRLAGIGGGLVGPRGSLAGNA